MKNHSSGPIIWRRNLSVWASREAPWKWKAIKHTGWSNSLHWALLKCNSSRRRQETKGPELPTTMSSLLHSKRETAFSSRTNSEWRERGWAAGSRCIHSNLGGESAAEKKRDKGQKTLGITDAVWRYIQYLLWSWARCSWEARRWHFTR